MIYLSDQVILVALYQNCIIYCVYSIYRLSQNELADSFPVKRKMLDLIFMQTDHFLVKFYILSKKRSAQMGFRVNPVLARVVASNVIYRCLQKLFSNNLLH